MKEGLATTTERDTQVKRFPVIEWFGPVIQGEGQMIGRQTLFLRLGGCDYRCCWCDTLYAVLPEEVKKNRTMMTSESIMAALRNLSPECKTVTISGGNPALHDLWDLTDMLLREAYYIAVETQGSRWADWIARCHCVTVSPKPPSSGHMTSPADLAPFIHKLHPSQVNFKVVVFDDRDYEYAKFIRGAIPCYSFTVQAGTNPDQSMPKDQVRTMILDNLERLMDRVCNDPDMTGVQVLPQLHTLVFGHKRGV